MNTFYSIVSATLNPLTDENVSLGLLLSDGSCSRYAFSANRLSLIKNLMAADQYQFIRDYLKSFQVIIDKIDPVAGSQTVMNTLQQNLVINEPYLNYLSIYGQNVVKVSAPVAVDLPVNDSVFQKLFEKFVDRQGQPGPREKKPIIQVKEEFAESVQNHFKADRELSADDFAGLELPVTVDLFGRNDQFVIAQFVDLERQVNFIKTDLYDLEHVNLMVEQKTLFFVSQEPLKASFPKQHHLWDQIRRDSKYRYVELKEIDQVREYAEVHGVIPW